MEGPVGISTSAGVVHTGVWLPGGVLTLAIIGVVVAAVVGGRMLGGWHWWARVLFAVLGLAAAVVGIFGAGATGALLAGGLWFGLATVVFTVLAASMLAGGTAWLLRLARSTA